MNVAAVQPPRFPLALREAVAVSIWLGLHLGLACPAFAELESGDYQTLPGATMEEFGDRVTNWSRIVPVSATFTFDLDAAPPLLIAVMPNAVLEGGNPFALTVRSKTGAQLTDGTYCFGGDYLQELYPLGTQYGFDWRFSMSSNRTIMWNGITGWAGGHIWQVTISNVTLVPAARLSISRVGIELVQITWATNFTNHVLEHTSSLVASDWEAVTNAVATIGDWYAVTVARSEVRQFYRLRML